MPASYLGNKQVNILIQKDLLTEIESAAKKDGICIQDWIRNICRSALGQNVPGTVGRFEFEEAIAKLRSEFLEQITPISEGTTTELAFEELIAVFRLELDIKLSDQRTQSQEEIAQLKSEFKETIDKINEEMDVMRGLLKDVPSKKFGSKTRAQGFGGNKS